MSDEGGIGIFHHHNRFIYWTAIGILLVLVLIGLLTFRGAKDTRAANEKADQFISQLQSDGVERLPSKDQVVRVLGSDGGAVCEDPGNALGKATLFSMITNGAAGPGARPIVTDSRLINGQLAVIQVYCPDKLDDFKSYVDDLKYGDVVKG
jgi:hypothetical protein